MSYVSFMSYVDYKNYVGRLYEYVSHMSILWIA